MLSPVHHPANDPDADAVNPFAPPEGMPERRERVVERRDRIAIWSRILRIVIILRFTWMPVGGLAGNIIEANSNHDINGLLVMGVWFGVVTLASLVSTGWMAALLGTPLLGVIGLLFVSVIPFCSPMVMMSMRRQALQLLEPSDAQAPHTEV